MEELPEGIDSKFRYVLLVSKRAEQLIQGAQPKTKPRHSKPTRIAMEEVEQDAVKWQLTPPVEEPTALEEGEEIEES
jgi:DNA-directed RNA polymerase subunit omega